MPESVRPDSLPPDPSRPEAFRRIAVVNRGEPALRLIRAVRELNRDGGEGLETIALYTDPDRRSLFVREADDAFCLGSATFVDERDGLPKNRYLDYAALERALRETRAEAAWVGWGFVAEHAEFAELCRRLGVVFIGPDPKVMRSLGDKIGSKRMAEQAGVPVAPWSGGPVDSLEDARRHAERLGFPLMVKATAGGGGRGIRRVRSAAELADAFESARSEARKSFGDPTVFMERLLEGARHIEVQIVGDGETTWALGVRDCTVQRRNQKVIEESPSPALSEEQQRDICAAAARLGDAAGYRNAGTVEFLYDQAERSFSFMEVNARLQVEHPVTECTTGADLVKLQLHVAAGGRLEGEPPPQRGHAIEVRVNAEDPERGFAPSPGTIELLRLPGGPGIRIDSGFVEGDTIASEFDSMLAKLIATGRDREEALGRLERALLEMSVAIRGGASNKGFLLGLLRRPEVRSGEVDVGWLDALAAREEHLPEEGLPVAILQAAIDAYDEDLDVEQAQFYATAARGRFRVRSEIGSDLELSARGLRYALRVFRVGPDEYRVDVDGMHILVRVDRMGAFERRLEIAGQRFRVLTQAHGLDRIVEVDGIPHRLSRDDAGMVRSPAPAMVLQILVGPGDEVQAGDRLAILEAMKTELPVVAPCSGKVRGILVAANSQVDTGAPLLVLEPVESEVEVRAGERVAFEAFAAPAEAEQDPARRCRANLEGLRRVVLGFDVEPGDAARLVDGRRTLCSQLAPEDPDLLAGEDEILAAFADVCALFTRRGSDWERGDEEARVPEEFLLLYLRSLDPAAAGLSTSFVDRLERALGHYGVEDLDRTLQLQQSLLWIAKAHARMGEQVGVVLKILERRLDHAAALVPAATPALRELLDRIVSVTRGRYQAVSDLAREVGYRLFDRPFFEQIRGEVYAEADAHLAALAGDPGDRAARLRALVDCPEPLVTRLTQRFAEADAPSRRTMLEVLTRRYYRIRPIEKLEAFEAGGRSFVRAEYLHEGRRVHLLTTHARIPTHDETDDLGAAAAEVARLLGAVPVENDLLVDFYVRSDAPATDPDAPEMSAAEERCPAHRARAERERRRRGNGRDGPLHLAAGRRAGAARGSPAPRAASDDGQAARALAPGELRRRARALGRGRLPVPRHRPGEPQGRAALCLRGGAGPDADPRRSWPHRAASPTRDDGDGGPGRHPAVPIAAQREEAAALEPPGPSRLAERRARCRGNERDRPPTGAGQRRARHAEDPGARPHARREDGRAPGHGDPDRQPRRPRDRVALHGAGGRAHHAALRVRPEGRTHAPARHDLSLRADPHVDSLR
jgi:acetyl/propionyl-CoA carboxylase alpha subunit